MSRLRHAQASSAQICVGKSHTTSLLGCSEVEARETAARSCGGSAGGGLAQKNRLWL